MYYDEYCYWAQVAVLLMYLDIGLLGHVIYRLYTGYVLRVELPVQRRLCPIFVRDVGSPDIHERFRGLTGSQRTPRFWGVTDIHYCNVLILHIPNICIYFCLLMLFP